MQRIPDFALFLEQLNLECSATAYRQALQELGRLPGMALEDKDPNREFVNVTRMAQGAHTEKYTPSTPSMVMGCAPIFSYIL